ncbi:MULTISPECIES: hypothetical protein [Methanobacterium]|jgi:hypothetical protein|uniref:Uncharacterized protein n=1 Tax=Methanobacterium veterum TaxID=408577 RepID=A0A9E5DP82_9EURY|nr:MULTISPECIES: hypothetical protein [Methanobacterium]MCZ3367186.1 hypothetical protein [Methanobacterium veterum]MCZ3373666.1 hypothetical protein [Methanobacterium veterum]
MPKIEKKILKAKEYERMISNLDIESFELKTSSILEARMTLIGIERIEENLLEIRRQVSADMRAVKLKYLNYDYSKSSLLGSIKRTKVSSKRKSIDKKCDRELGPYEKVLYIIDDYLEQIKDVKDYISKIKA